MLYTQTTDIDRYTIAEQTLVVDMYYGLSLSSVCVCISDEQEKQTNLMDCSNIHTNLFNHQNRFYQEWILYVACTLYTYT